MVDLWRALGHDVIASKVEAVLSAGNDIVVLEGPPGVGKSSIARGIGAMWEEGGGTAVIAEGDLHNSDKSLYPFDVAMGRCSTQHKQPDACAYIRGKGRGDPDWHGGNCHGNRRSPSRWSTARWSTSGGASWSALTTMSKTSSTRAGASGAQAATAVHRGQPALVGPKVSRSSWTLA